MVNLITEELQQEIINGKFLHCKDLHDGSCILWAIFRFFGVLQKCYKVYIVLYLVPLIVFKRNQLKKYPINTLKSTAIAYFQSVTYLALFVAIFNYFICKTKNFRQKIDSLNPVISSFIASFSILLETKGRRKEISLFLLPRTIESIYQGLRRRNMIFDLSQHGKILFGMILAILNFLYQNQQENIQKNFLSVVQKCWGII